MSALLMAQIISRLPPIVPPDFPNDVIALEPYLYYRCNEVSGDAPNMIDSSGNSRPGVFTSVPTGPSLLTGRPTEKSYLPSQRPRTNQPTSGGTHILSTYDGGWTLQILIKQTGANIADTGFFMTVGSSSTNIPSLLSINVSSPTGFRIVASRYFVADEIFSSVVHSYGTTVLVHLRYTVSTNKLELFENGALTGSSTGNNFSYYGNGGYFADCPHPITGAYDYPFNGSISNVAIFRKPLTNVQIYKLASGI